MLKMLPCKILFLSINMANSKELPSLPQAESYEKILKLITTSQSYVSLKPLMYDLFVGNHDKVEECRINNLVSVHEIAQGYALAGNHDKVEEYRIKHQASVQGIAKGYAHAGNHDKVEEYRAKHHISVHSIIKDYAQANNHAKVEEYRIKHQISVNQIALIYAHEGNHDKVEEYRIKHNASVKGIVKGYALAGNHDKVEEYQIQDPTSVHTIALGYAHAGNHDKVDEYRIKHHASVDEIAKGYAYAGNHTKVEEYRIKHQASVHEIAKSYAHTGNHDKVEEYRIKHHASVHEIAKGYAHAGSHDKVEEYRIKHQASVDEIVKGYAYAGNHYKVEEYRIKHQASVDEIARGYARLGYHDEVEEYQIIHFASVYEIIKGYAEADNHAKVEEYRVQHQISVNQIASIYALFGKQYKVDEYRNKYQASVQDIAPGYAQADNDAKEQKYRTNYPPSITGDTKANNQENIVESTKPSNAPTQKSIENIRGGIHTKYITGTPHPRLPEEQRPVNSNTSTQRKLPFTPVCNMSSASTSFYTHSIATPAFSARLLTEKKDLELASLNTFICAGRTKNALVPVTEGSRCTLICTEEEVIELLPHLSSHLDLLVISKIESKYNGEYTDLGSITARRLAAFLFAYHANCPKFSLLDDNIERLSFSPEIISSDSWDAVIDFLGHQMAQKASFSVGTANGHKKKHGELGSKFFMINMQLIRQKLQEEEDLFCLFPEATQAKKWGEDFYFQIVLHYLFAEQNIAGYGIIPLQKIGLFRSKHHQNFFAASGKKAEFFEIPTPSKDISSPFSQVIERAVRKLNQIIQENYLNHERMENSIQNVDLLSLHAKANNQNPDMESSTPALVQNPSDFKTDFAKAILNYDFATTMLRDYQIQAIKAAATYSGPSRIVMATGSGKSLIQCTLALMAYHTSAPNQPIFIVTPHIELVIQFYEDLLRYNDTLKKSNNLLSIPSQNIITVSSHMQSISVRALLQNQPIRQQKSIIICCEDSFNKLLDENRAMIHQAALILLDEYHEYTKTVKELVEGLPSAPPMVIASSATPPTQDVINNNLYSFSLRQALNGIFHAPLIVDTLNIPYSPENVDLIIKWLPQILRNQYHPGFQEGATLAETKGIIYLKSIKLCEQAQKILREAGLNAYAIHSDNSLASEEAKQFVKNDQPGILLAVRKLRFGFDCPDLAWEFILRPPSQKSARQDIEQMLGRVIRRYQDKLGYVVTFEDIFNRYILPITQEQEKIPALSTDYLANADAKEYYLDENGCIVVDSDFLEITDAMDDSTEDNSPMMIDSVPAETQGFSVRFFQSCQSQRTRKHALSEDAECNKRPR